MIYNLFFSAFLFFLSFLLVSSDSLENPCLFDGIDYSGLSEFPDFPVSVSNCEQDGVNNYLFSLCRPLKNSLGKSLNASAILIGSAGDDEVYGIFPSKTVVSPVLFGNLSQGITIKAFTAAAPRGPQIFINLYCWQNNPVDGHDDYFLLNPWLGQQTIFPNMAVGAQGQCDSLEIYLFSNCVCPGYGENPLKPCSPPSRPTSISMAFQDFPSSSLLLPGPNGEILSLLSSQPSTIDLTTIIPTAWAPGQKIPLNYSFNTATLKIPAGLNEFSGVVDIFPDGNKGSKGFYVVTSSPQPLNVIEYSFFLVEENGKSINFLFSSNVSGAIINCVSRPNLFHHLTTKTIVCVENDFGLSQCSLGEYVYQVQNTTNMVKNAMVYPEISYCPQIALSYDSTKILMISNNQLLGFDVRSKNLISNVSLSSFTVLSLLVDHSLEEENVFFLVQTSSLGFPKFPGNDYAVYQLVEKEFILIYDLPDMILWGPTLNFFLDSVGCHWILVGSTLVRVDPAEALKLNKYERFSEK